MAGGCGAVVAGLGTVAMGRVWTALMIWTSRPPSTSSRGLPAAKARASWVKVPEATMIVQEGLNASTLNWRRLVYDLLDDLRVLLGTGSPDYRRRLAVMVSEVQKGTAMCEPRSSSDGVDTA